MFAPQHLVRINKTRQQVLGILPMMHVNKKREELKRKQTGIVMKDLFN